MMYGGMAQPSLLALEFIGCLVSLIGQWPTGPPNINATPPPCNRTGLSRSGLWGPELLHSLSGIRDRPSSELTRASCPGYGYARSSGIHAYRHAGEESPLRRAMHWNRCWRVYLSNFVPSYFALQRSDSSPPLVLRLRGLGLARFGSLGLITLGFARLWSWKLSWLFTEV